MGSGLRPGPARAGEGLALAALAAFGLGLLAAPLALLFAEGLVRDGAPTLAPLAAALESRAVRAALRNSVESAALSAVLALGLGTALALAVALTDLRGKGPITFLLLLPMMIPPHVTAIAWTQLVGPSSAVLGAFGLAPPPGTPNPLHGRGGVVLLLALQHAPLVFLVLLAAARALPREAVEAARSAGAGPARTLGRVVLPLVAPALLAALALAFVAALGNFGIPALLGIPGGYTTLPVLIWQRLAGFGPGMLQGVAVLSALMAGVALVAAALQMALAARAGARLSGPPQPPLRFGLGRGRPLAEGAVALFLGAVLALPLAALVATALVPVYGVPLGAATVTLENFREVLLRQSVTARAFLNSTLAAGLAGAILAALALAAAFIALPRRGFGRRLAGAVAALAEVTYAIPGIVISIAFILAFLRPLPLAGVTLYGTLALILLAYLAAFAAVALKPVAAAAAQLDPALDEAARVAGAGFGRRLAAVFAPMVAPAAASGAILVFLTAYNEITVSVLLWSRGNETIGTTIFNYESGGATTLAAAMAAVTVAATAALMLVLDAMGRRLPPGVVPWRL